MSQSFYKYFVGYISKSKTRQKLLTLAIIGLFLSSFSLLVLQGVMGGLQKGVISRSKNVNGAGYIAIPETFNTSDLSFLESSLKEKNIEYLKEYEVELLVKNGDILRPVILHGIDLGSDLPKFLKDKNFNGAVLGADLATSLKSFFEDKLLFISPSHSDFLVTEIPRQSSIEFSDIVVTDVEQTDRAHGWVAIEFLQNLTRARTVNKITFFTQGHYNKAFDNFNNSLDLKFIKWESQNKSLVWALNLETTVMIILFVAMSLLVAICITSGFMIFFDKVKTDLLSFWVLGLSQSKIFKLLFSFTQVLSFIFIACGVIVGLGVLKLLDSKSLGFVPDIFVEQNIPISVSFENILISFMVPYLISCVFSYFSYRSFKSENSSFIKLIRSVG